ncbi:MAG: hypothetical protein HYY44_02510 [Deltaproteobacteria bacterium]|nr:hypothetical protein [Deltaproteobacteria bacterium]
MRDKISSLTPIEFFRERVQEALERRRLDPPQGVEFYLVNLLGDYVKTDELYAKTAEGLRQQALAILLQEAVSSGQAQRITLFKKIGDLSLFTVGFFPDSLKRQLVNVDYYVHMGESAYDNLSHILTREKAFEEIYTELSQHFVAYVDVLSEVSEKSEILNDSDLLRIYETWLKTGSERAKQRLSEEGIVAIPNVSLKPQ